MILNFIKQLSTILITRARLGFRKLTGILLHWIMVWRRFDSLNVRILRHVRLRHFSRMRLWWLGRSERQGILRHQILRHGRLRQIQGIMRQYLATLGQICDLAVVE